MDRSLPFWIKFFNDTRRPMRIYWADFRGGLTPMSDWIQPGGVKGFDTFAGHAWLAKVNAPERLACSVPISAPRGAACTSSSIMGLAITAAAATTTLERKRIDRAG